LHRLLQRSAQLGDFYRRQCAPLAGLDIQRQRTIPNTLDLLDMMSDLLEHPTDLPVSTFRQRDLVPGVITFTNDLDLRRQCRYCKRSTAFSRPFAASPFRHRRFCWQLDSCAQPIELILAGLATHLHQVSFRDVRSRCGQLLHQVAVVSQQQQSLGVKVEPSDREDALADVPYQVHDSRASFRVADRGNELPRFVEHYVEVLFRSLDAFTVKSHVIGLKVSLGTEGSDGFTIYGDTSAGNELLCLATGSDACGGEDLLQTF